MYLNSLLALPVVLAMSYWFGDFDRLWEYEYIHNTGFLFLFFISCCLAFALNYSMFQCTSVNSPLTTSITGQTKNVALALFGLVVFPDASRELLHIFGHCVCAIGAGMYFRATFVNS